VVGDGLGILDGVGLGKSVGADVSGHSMQVSVIEAAAKLPFKPVG
jgi:hypothetical protein